MDIEKLKNNLDEFNTSYTNFIEAVGIINNILVILDKPDYDNFDFASSINTGRAKAAMGIFNTILDISGASGVATGSLFGATYMSVALSLFEEIADNLERLYNTVGGMILMALGDEVYDIDAVFNGENTIEDYIYQ